MAKGLLTLSAGQLAEALGPLGVEAEGDDRIVVLTKGATGIDEVGAIDGGAARGLNPEHLIRGFLQWQGGTLLRGILICGCRLFQAEKLESEFRGAADDVLHLIGILNARQLDCDAILALLLDGRFRGAQGIDAILDDLQGLAMALRSWRPARFEKVKVNAGPSPTW